LIYDEDERGKQRQRSGLFSPPVFRAALFQIRIGMMM
jgi:hypothetical protein